MTHRPPLADARLPVYVSTMTTNAPSRGYLGGLWRDRVTFVVVSTLILFANLVHPLAEARAAGSADAWIICSSFGAAKDPSAPAIPGAADDCPLCIAGHGSCALPAMPAAGSLPAPAATRAFRLPLATSVPRTGNRVTVPPAIRAPPAFS